MTEEYRIGLMSEQMTFKEFEEIIEFPCVVTMVGPSGSGKSSFARKLVDDESQILSSDHMRKRLSGDATEQSVTGIVFDVIYNMLEVRSTYQQTTVIDATNLKRRNRKAYWGPVTKDLPTYAVVMDTSVEECKNRQAKRDRQVPEWVVDKHAERASDIFNVITEEKEQWDGVFKVAPRENKKGNNEFLYDIEILR